MNAVVQGSAIKTLTTHYIDGAFVESNGREVMDIVRPTDGQVIGRVTLLTKRIRGAPSARPSAHLRPTAGRRRKNAWRFCGGCMRPLRRTSMI